jgi:hypothetical protein
MYDLGGEIVKKEATDPQIFHAFYFINYEVDQILSKPKQSF